ncbi:CCR4-NOT transcription complex subunit 10 [Exaiptasia diaphana]|nr:CCR4-NOT transcription complex subunit 10 [Exaiptasia diaphana]
MTELDTALDSNLESLQADPTGIKISDQERQLANQAHVEFESQQYEKCLEALDKLGDLRQSDHKVVHNKAVAQFYQAKFTKTDEFYKNLMSTKKQVEHQIGDDSDDLDMAYLLYNEAVVCYNLRQYNTAVCTLNR